MRRCHEAILCGLLACAVATPSVAAPTVVAQAKRKKKKPPEPPPAEIKPVATETEAPVVTAEEAERRKQEEAKRVEEGRKLSKVAPGEASRWSNKGALEPITEDVPITAPLPVRNVPVAAGVATPGQDLVGNEELLSARLSLSFYHLETRGQDFVWQGEVRIPNQDRDIDLMRGRAMLAYQRIANTQFSVHLDLEYRPRFNGARFTDQRLNEAYVAWGLTDFRRNAASSFGLALGRLAIREAGFAQADGLAARLRLLPELHIGAFGGVTGNPYGYNWALRNSQTFSANWFTAGAFGAFQSRTLSVNLAGVATIANIAGNLSGLDRLYAYLDAAWLVMPDLNVFLTGWIDVLPSDQIVQNVEAVGSYRPIPEVDLTLGLGRFSTVMYELSSGYSFSSDPFLNRYCNGVTCQVNNLPALAPIVDAAGVPIVTFDSALLTAVYNQVRLRAGYRPIREVEVFVAVPAQLRDLAATQTAQIPLGAAFQQASLRMLPTAGARYRDPDLLDANLSLTYVLDDSSNADFVVRGGLGRELFGFYLGADARALFGTINAADAGVELAYTFPRDWFPGALSLRGMFRYFREDLALDRPLEDKTAVCNRNEVCTFTIPLQESFMGFGGVEWRL